MKSVFLCVSLMVEKKDSGVLKCERCEHRDNTSIVVGESRRCEVLIVFCVERPSEAGSPLEWGEELCGSFSYVGGLRSLFNTEGILTANVCV